MEVSSVVHDEKTDNTAIFAGVSYKKNLNTINKQVLAKPLDKL
jgi:hypothetical protein